MGVIVTDTKGVSLRNIIRYLGDRDYEIVEFRCKWIDLEGENQDIAVGYCKYKNGELIPLDGDTYSLDDVYNEWREWIDVEENYVDNGGLCLTVWEEGVEITFDEYDRRFYEIHK